MPTKTYNKVTGSQGKGSISGDGTDKQEEHTSLKSTVTSATVLALAGIGDAFLYPLLPVFGDEMGLSVVWVGVLLSVNKYVRVFANRYVAFLIGHVGYRKVTVVASVLATLTTLTYGLDMGIWLWVIARLLWGFSFAALRISSVGYATNYKRQGLSLGLNRAIQESGPLLALWLGPFLLSNTGFRTTFVLFAVLSSLSIMLSTQLPEVKLPMQQINLWKLEKSGALDAWVFLGSFAVEGVLTVTVGLLFSDLVDTPGKALGLTAFYISCRRLASFLLTPFAGVLADKWGLKRFFNLSMPGIPLGLGAIAVGYVEAGVLIAFFAHSINSALVPGVGLQQVSEHRKLLVLSALATSRDVGSATGALLGAGIFVYLTAVPLFAGLAVLLCLQVVAFLRIHK